MEHNHERQRLFSASSRSAFLKPSATLVSGLMADRIDEITEAFEAVWSERGGGHNGQPHAGEARSCIVPFIDQSAALSSLIDDPRIHALATTLLGDDFNYMGSDGNYYVGDTGWHSDGWHPKGRPQHLKIAFT